jgi:hypothetical protein
MVIVEKLVEGRLARETEVLGDNLPRRHFIHHKSHMTGPEVWTRAAAVGSQRLAAWAMARPKLLHSKYVYMSSWEANSRSAFHEISRF